MFLFILVLFTAVLYGVVGPKGMVVNRALARHVEQEQHWLDIQRLLLENLQHQFDQVHTKESILDAARAMGYVQRGERVYLFFDAEGKAISFESESNRFPLSASRESQIVSAMTQGVSFFLCLVISLLFSVLMIGSIALVRRRRRPHEPVILSFNGEVYGNHHSKT